MARMPPPLASSTSGSCSARHAAIGVGLTGALSSIGSRDEPSTHTPDV